MNWKDTESEFEEIQKEWEQHRTMNACSICDSPKGHTSIKSFLKAKLTLQQQEWCEKIEERRNIVDNNGKRVTTDIFVDDIISLIKNKI